MEVMVIEIRKLDKNNSIDKQIFKEACFIEELQAREVGVDYFIKKLTDESIPCMDMFKDVVELHRLRKLKEQLQETIKRHSAYLEWLEDGAQAPIQK